MNPFLQLAQAAVSYLKRLADRLAPPNPTSTIVLANKGQHTKGVTIADVNCNGPFNTFINNLSSGTVNVYFGSTGGQPHMVLKPTENPLQIPLGARIDKHVLFVVDPNSEPAQGSIFLEQN